VDGDTGAFQAQLKEDVEELGGYGLINERIRWVKILDCGRRNRW